MRCELIGSLSVPSFSRDRQRERERERTREEREGETIARSSRGRSRSRRAAPLSSPRSIDRVAIFRKSYKVARFEVRFSIAKQKIAISWSKIGEGIFLRRANYSSRMKSIVV